MYRGEKSSVEKTSLPGYLCTIIAYKNYSICSEVLINLPYTVLLLIDYVVIILTCNMVTNISIIYYTIK